LRHETANQLATLFVCAGEDWLRKALPAALARVLCIAAADAGLMPNQFDFGTTIPPSFALPVSSVARLLALDDLIRHFATLKKRRQAIQTERRCGDSEVQALLAADPVDEEWADAGGDGARALCRILGLSSPLSVAVTQASNIRGNGASHSPSAATDVAQVSIIVLTALGPRHLPECLDSLAKLDYPKSATEVIVVDNGSAEDPTDT